MSKRKGPNRENLEQTRRVFMDIGREEFVLQGYSDASTNAIVQNSGMARGSLYYHFGDKFGLFRAIYAQMLEECYAHVSAKMDVYDDPFDSLLEGCAAYLDYCMRDDFRKIVLIEAQAAISYGERIQMLEGNLLGRLHNVLAQIMDQYDLKGQTPKTALIFIMGMLSESGRSFDYSEDIKQDYADCVTAIRTTLQGWVN